jgi:hypothetical protein
MESVSISEYHDSLRLNYSVKTSHEEIIRQLEDKTAEQRELMLKDETIRPWELDISKEF